MSKFRVIATVLFLIGVASVAAYAQTDEIQVYDASIAAPGIFNLTWHNNFTPKGLTTPAFPGAIISNHSWNGVPEWAYGVNDWFELGLYMPLYSVSEGRGSTLNGFKVRTLFVVPHADERTFFYGLNFEFSYNAVYWEQRRFSQELRPILGVHIHPFHLGAANVHPIDVIVNPIVDTEYDGFKNIEFNPASRIAYNLNSQWAVAAEEYDGFGPFRGFAPTDEQYHMIWAVVDHSSKTLDVEAGVGYGLTPGTDTVTLKLILSRDLNRRPIRP